MSLLRHAETADCRWAILGEVESLFDQISRSDRTPAERPEGHYAFLNRVGGLYFDRIRSLLEDWLAAAPNEERRGLLGRLRSDDDRIFTGAFWELYQAEALRRSGFTVTYHPNVTGSTRQPDFLAERADGSFYLEATIASASNDEAANTKRQDVLYHEINNVPSPNFWLSVSIDARGDRNPPTRRLKADLTAWLGSLDPDELRPLVEQGRSAALPEMSWEEAGWRLTFQPLAKSEDARGRSGRTIGIYSPEGGYIDSARPLRKALREKSSRYGALDRPYVVAVLIQSIFVRDDDVLDALFGSRAIRFSIDPDDDRTELVRNRDGAWFGQRGPTGTRVSAVVVATNLAPWTVTRNAPWAVLNPWAAKPLTIDLRWRTASPNEANSMLEIRAASVSASDLFALPPVWPGPEGPFEE